MNHEEKVWKKNILIAFLSLRYCLIIRGRSMLNIEKRVIFKAKLTTIMQSGLLTPILHKPFQIQGQSRVTRLRNILNSLINEEIMMVAHEKRGK